MFKKKTIMTDEQLMELGELYVDHGEVLKAYCEQAYNTGKSVRRNRTILLSALSGIAGGLITHKIISR